MPGLPALLLAVTAASALAPDGAAGRIVEEVVAVVRIPATNQLRVITLSRLAEEARIALVSRGAAAAALAPIDAPALRAALEWLIDQTVLMDEAARLQVFEVDAPEVRAELKRFQGRFARPEDYRAFLDKVDLTEEELAAVLRRMLRVQHYLDSRVSRAGRIRDAEVEAWARDHQAETGGRPLAEMREAIRRHLAEQRVKAEVRSVVQELRGRAEIRVLATLEGPVE